MEPLCSIGEERARVLAEIQTLVADVAGIVSGDARTWEDALSLILRLRARAYEDLNQLQHEALILEAAMDIERQFRGVDVEWSWNPRQTGSSDEPDLQGTIGGKAALCAEVTASSAPVGVIDGRMRDTLKKLSAFPGKRFYCVRTLAMQQRAETKIAKAGHDIEVLLLSHGRE